MNVATMILLAEPVEQFTGSASGGLIPSATPSPGADGTAARLTKAAR